MDLEDQIQSADDFEGDAAEGDDLPDWDRDAEEEL